MGTFTMSQHFAPSIMNAKSNLCRYSLENDWLDYKFSYAPVTGELLVDVLSSSHKEMIRSYGKGPYESYIRGIYFRSKNTIYLRQHENTSMMIQTVKFLKSLDLPSKTRVIYGKKASQDLSDELRGL